MNNMERMASLKAKASAAATQAKEASKVAASQAKEATKNAYASASAYHQAHPDAASNALSGAKNFVTDCAKKAWLPTKELQDFFTNPSVDALAEKPELIFQGMAAMAKASHPKAALLATMMKEGMSKAQSSGAEAATQAANTMATSAANAAVTNATGGMVTQLPPEVSQAAVAHLKKNPKQMMELMKYAGEAAAKTPR